MPANRRPQDRQEKRAEIVDAAEQLFVDVGFEDTPMARIAAAAGVTTTTIYWYFDDKDALLVAVLDQVLASALREHAAAGEQPWDEQLLWVITRLRRLHRLVSVVHARVSSSPVVNDWHDRFHALADINLAEGFRAAGVREQDLPAATRIAVFVIEGLLTHTHDEQTARDIVRLLGALT
ncbi:MAG: hypothetical protein QOJ32_3022 [Frankiaceae bacterium]|nr:hypothetical protein [Frankiaceae bacterium]